MTCMLALAMAHPACGFSKAVWDHQTAVFGDIVDDGTDPSARELIGETPLMAAARQGYSDVVKNLIDDGADINARNKKGQTALMIAIEQNHSDVVALLREAGGGKNNLISCLSPGQLLPLHLS